MNEETSIDQSECPRELRLSQQMLSRRAQALIKLHKKVFTSLCNRALAQDGEDDCLLPTLEELEEEPLESIEEEGFTTFPDFPAPSVFLLTWRRWFDEAKECRVVEVIDFQMVCFNSIDILRAGASPYEEELDEMSPSRRKQLFDWYATRLLEVASEEDLKRFLKKRIKVSFKID